MTPEEKHKTLVELYTNCVYSNRKWYASYESTIPTKEIKVYVTIKLTEL